jgi:hypothetical protein
MSRDSYTVMTITSHDWCADYVRTEGLPLAAKARATGVYERAYGGHARYGQVQLTAAPNPQQGAVFKYEIEDAVAHEYEERGWLLSIALGVMDVMLVAPPHPITEFICTVQRVRSHELDTTAVSLRFAARNAARKILVAVGEDLTW